MRLNKIVIHGCRTGGCEMTYNYLKCAGLAAVLSGISFGLAQAETPTPPPPFHIPNAALADSTMAPQSPRGGGYLGSKTASNAYVVGWNFRTCRASQYYQAGSLFYEYIYNTDGSYWYYFTGGPDWVPQAQFRAACQHGGYYIYVTSLSPIAFDSVYIPYP
jgi:hypothetical protein